MEKRLGTVTLGVRNLARARQFYEQGLGWTRDGGEDDIAFYQLGGSVVGLYEWPKLAKDSGSAESGEGFRGVTLGYVARSADEVDQVLHAAERAGAQIQVHPRKTFWGGYSGYFADLDGHLWEVMWNPHLEVTERGEHLMKPAP
jgi:catechol 2,3-dioxygenase-like lactoylglutathione lyase family enzyme